MRVLFSVNNFGFLRNFEPALRLLAARGHDLHLVAERRDTVGGMKTIENLVSAHPDRISYGYAPSRKHAFWQPLAVQLRLTLDYWRYLDPLYDESPSLRARGARQAPALATRLPEWPLVGGPSALRGWGRLARAMERAIPVDEAATRLLRESKPDLLLLTPLLYFGSQQVEYVRAARELGIPTVLGVGSWDHLTTKGLIHEQPDRVLVWNEMQRTEAVELHGIPRDRITVTGAQAYDHWFTQSPSRTREAFCAQVGLPADRPLLLYLCSSPFITPHEVPFVRRWIEAVRSAPDPDVRRAALLIRPHPQNAEQWRGFDTSGLEAVSVFPAAGANPVDRDARADYFDSMYHSVGVVGVNTSALIESGIVGRPVFSVIAEEFSGQQEGTLHFRHLRSVAGGLLHVGRTLGEHLEQLAAGVRGTCDPAKSRAFVEAFVRPHGLDTPAAVRVADAIEAEAGAARRPSPRPRLTGSIWRTVLWPAAAVARRAEQRRRSDKGEARNEGKALTGPGRILFVLASPEFLRYYDSTMRLLADRGHRVLVAVNWARERKHARLDLVGDPRIELLGVVPKRNDVWTGLVRSVRGTIDFVRYLHPRFADAPALRARMYRKVLPVALRPLNRLRTLAPATVDRSIRALQAMERVTPIGERVAGFLAECRPDIVVVSPLVDAGSDQVDIVRAAQAAGIPVVAAIASWDNLTNKGHLRVSPDMVTVWNEYQKAEAIEMHGIPAERIHVTGAQLFDRWFERRPSTDRAAFVRMVGLPDERPFVLFTGSSVFIARSDAEVPFVRRWIESLRQSADPVLRDVAVLVRPHPFNPDAWITADFSDLGAVAVWPRQRYTPASEESRTSFFDTLYHCHAVVGINTSAMIEAAILEKPVLSLLTGDFAGTQEGTLHFRYLLPENGGFLRIAQTFDAHGLQLGEVLRNAEATRAQTRDFVGRFLRPHGLDAPCTPILADTIERARVVAAPGGRSAGAAVGRVLLWPAAVMFNGLPSIDGTRRFAWRVSYETYDAIRRTSRTLLKRVVVRPARALKRLPRHVHRGVHYGTRAMRRWPALLIGRTRLATRRLGSGLERRGKQGRVWARRLAQRLFGLPAAAMSGLRHSGVSGDAVMRATRHARFHLGMRLGPLARALGLQRRSDPEDDAGPAPRRILFSMRNFWFLRLFDSAIRELAARGHQVHILADYGEERSFTDEAQAALDALIRDCPNVTWSWAPQDIEDEWVDLRMIVRLGLDYLRFLAPGYAEAPILAARARGRTHPLVVRLAEHRLWGSRAGRALLTRVMQVAEGLIPPDQALASAIEQHAADVVLVTPLVTLGSVQPDVVTITRRLGLPSALCVASWDHLSSKALIRRQPDRVFVWNDIQRGEAMTLHGVASGAVEVTGAQCFDQWFDRSPSLDAAAFRRRVGLPADRPFIVYVCSALFEGSPSEARFVERWIEAVRAHGSAVLRECGILVRPHPRRSAEWDDVDLTRFAGVSLWPPRGVMPLDDDSRADYFDSLYHGAAVVGLNTSALIEGAIVGRPVHTVLLPEFADNQEGTVHFRYLLEGGFLHATRDLSTHVDRLAESVTSSAGGRHQFVEAFVRPLGGSVAATPIFADAVERLGQLTTRPEHVGILARLGRWALYHVAIRTRWTFGERAARARQRRAKETDRRLERAAKERARQQRYAKAERRRMRVRAAAERQKQEQLEAQQRRRAEHAAGKQREREQRRAERARAIQAKRDAKDRSKATSVPR